MVVDASAVVAMLLDEPDGADLYDKLKKAKRLWICGLGIYETVLALMRMNDKDHDAVSATVNNFVKRHDFVFVDIDQQITALAVEAFGIYGKGRHSAKLNMGDCFSYACAKKLGQPLLFKGNDFNKTDIKLA